MGRKIRRVQENRSQKQKQFDENGLSPSSINTQSKYKDNYGYKKFNLTEKQVLFQDVIRDNILTFVEGPAGVGKTATALHYAIPQYLQDPTMRIIVIRTPVEAGGDKVGFLPSDLNEKTEPHFASTKLLLESLLSPEKVAADMNGRLKKIQFLIPNFAIGATWDNAIIIIDESQQIQPLIMKLLLERIGINSKVIVLGDPSQVYAESKDRQGMRDAIKRFFVTEGREVVSAKYPDIGYFKFEAKDCMRSDIVKTVLEAYSVPYDEKENTKKQG